MGERYSPRKLGLEELVRVLVQEHAVMREGLEQARDAARRKDFGAVARTLKEIDPVFRQHIVDEEFEILGLLIRSLGVKGAEKEILVFRQHRPIYALMTKIRELAAAPSGELEARETELEALFSEHARVEESEVFPKATSLGGRGSK